MTDTFSAPRFRDDNEARKALEAILWPDGPICPHCGVINHAYATRRPGVFRCAEKECRKDFTVTMKTVMERSKIALHKWLQAFHLMCSSKKGVSAHQLHRTLDITYEAAWFMAHRIREAMRAGGLHRSAAAVASLKRTKPTTATLISRICGANKEGRIRKMKNKRAHRRASRARRQRPHVPCSGCEQRTRCQDREARTLPARHGCIRTKATCIRLSARRSVPTRR